MSMVSGLALLKRITLASPLLSQMHSTLGSSFTQSSNSGAKLSAAAVSCYCDVFCGSCFTLLLLLFSRFTLFPFGDCANIDARQQTYFIASNVLCISPDSLFYQRGDWYRPSDGIELFS